MKVIEKLSKLPRSASFIVGALAILMPHLLVRGWSWKRFIVSGSDTPYFSGSDSYYHAHRIGQLFQSFPSITFHDPFMAFPRGTVAQWPFGFDYLVAALSSLGKLIGFGWSEVVWVLPFVSILVSIPVVFLFYRMMSRGSSPMTAWLATLCFSMGFAFIKVSHVGQLDHHIDETLGVVLLMVIPSIVSKGGSSTGAAITGIFLATLVWTTTLLAFLVSIFCVVWLTLRMFAVEAPCPPTRLGPFFVSLALCLILFCGIESWARMEFFSFGTLSFLHAGAILAPLGAMFCLGKLRPVVIVGLLSLPLISYVAIMPSAVGWILSFVFAHNPFISNVVEALPIFMTRHGPTFTPIHAYFGVAYVLFPFMFLMLRRTDRGDRGVNSPILAPAFWFALILFLISFSQKRFAHLFSPALVFVTFSYARTVAEAAPKRSTAAIVLSVASVLLLEPLWVFAGQTDAAPSLSTVRAVAVAKHIAELNIDPTAGVSAPPNMGNAINFVARRPSTSNTFFYERFLETDMRVRDFESTDALIEFSRDNHIGALVATDDVRYRTMLLGLFGRDDEAERFAKLEHLPCSEEYLRFAFDRLACLDEAPPGLDRTQTFVFGHGHLSLMRRAVVYRVPARTR